MFDVLQLDLTGTGLGSAAPQVPAPRATHQQQRADFLVEMQLLREAEDRRKAARRALDQDNAYMDSDDAERRERAPPRPSHVKACSFFKLQYFTDTLSFRTSSIQIVPRFQGRPQSLARSLGKGKANVPGLPPESAPTPRLNSARGRRLGRVHQIILIMSQIITVTLAVVAGVVTSPPLDVMLIPGALVRPPINTLGPPRVVVTRLLLIARVTSLPDVHVAPLLVVHTAPLLVVRIAPHLVVRLLITPLAGSPLLLLGTE